MKPYEYKDDGGRFLCKQHHFLRCSECFYVDVLEQQNKRYRNLLESLSDTYVIAKEIYKQQPDKKIIDANDLLQYILRKINDELGESK